MSRVDPREQAQRLDEITKASGVDELAEVTVYKGYRNKVGVTIEVLDSGPADPSYRYTVVATDERGRTATGNPGAQLSDVLREVHWQELDQPAPGGA